MLKLAAVTGILGVVLYLATVLSVAPPPRPDAPLPAVVSYFSLHRDAFITASTLTSVALLLLLPFLGALFAVLDGEEDGRRVLAVASVAAFVLIDAVTFVGSVALVAVAWRGAASVPASQVELAFDIDNLSLFALSATLAAATVILPIAVILRYRALSRPICLVGAASVVVNCLELAGIGARRGWDAAGYGDGVGLFLWFAWVGALCIAMLAHRSAAGATPPASVP